GRGLGRAIKIQVVMLSGTNGQTSRQQTLEDLRKSDWDAAPLIVQIHDETEEAEIQSAYLALRNSLAHDFDYVLLLEDDLQLNAHLRHNLQNWRPLRSGEVMMASIFNPGVREVACDLPNNARIVKPGSVQGGGAFLISRGMVEYIV